MIANIFLDLDGVLTNWVSSCVALFGRTEEEVISHWEPGVFDICSSLGITEEEMWDKVNAAGVAYWANLPETPWARELYDGCIKIAPTYFLTKPSHDAQSLAGKLIWIHRFTGNPKFKNFLIGAPKFLCAKPGHVLIDDSDKNVDEFRDNGGIGICLPAVWNRMHSYVEHGANPGKCVLSALRGLHEGWLDKGAYVRPRRLGPKK